MKLYRSEDIQAITDKLDQIIDDSLTVRNKVLEPTIDEYKQAMEVVRTYIRENKKIVYGGDVINTLVMEKNKEDRIYKDNDRKDIEFYSPEPVKDLVKLCDILHKKGFSYVQGSSATHDETFKIYVDFDNVCDITYMPRNIYSNMPVIKINNILYTHPSWVLVDTLRQYNDPILSFWRLKDKTFFRANVLQKYYPLELNTKHKYVNDTALTDYKKNIFNEIIKMESIIFLGSVAEHYYLTREKNIDVNNIEIISINFNEDIKTINLIVEKVLNNDYDKIVINMYKPFFQFRDEYVEFILNGTCLIKVFNNNKMCIPYNNLYINNDKINKIQLGGFYKEKKKSDDLIIKLGTFILSFNNVLIWRHYEYINRRDKYKQYEYLMSEMLKARNSYLDKNTLTVVDDSPYKEFIIRCSGKTMDNFKANRLKQKEKKQKKQITVFRYEPSDQKTDYVPPEFNFNNTSGNIVKNDISRVFS